MSETQSASPSPGGLRLACRPARSGNALVFPYRLDNDGPAEIYAMHAIAPAGAPSDAADETAAVIIAAETGDAVIGKFMPPFPADRRIAVPVAPLTRRVPAGGFVEGRIEVPLPLAETSPYFPDLTLRQYEVVDIKGIVLVIASWSADAADFAVRPCGYGGDLFTVLTADPLRTARLRSQRFPTTGLQLFRRTDAFPRGLG